MSTAQARSCKPTCARRRVTDPFRASTRIVEVDMLTDPPRGWERTPEADVFWIEELQALAMVLESRDRDGRRWRHIYISLPQPFDRDLAGELACELLGEDSAWFIGPRRDHYDPNRANARVHVCLDDPALPPPRATHVEDPDGMIDPRLGRTEGHAAAPLRPPPAEDPDGSRAPRRTPRPGEASEKRCNDCASTTSRAP